MRKHAIEQLERRQLLAVITNGLPVGDPAYLAVDVQQGGRFGLGGGTAGGLTFGSYPNVMFEYDAFLDVGQLSGTNTQRVFALSTGASDPVVDGNTATSTGQVQFLDGVVTRRVNYTVMVSIPNGGDRVNRSIRFTSSNYDLRKAKLFEYMDADIFDLGDDVLVVRGDIANGKLSLSTVDGQTYTWLSQEDGGASSGAQLTGFGADQFADLRTAILAGGYDPAATGTIDRTDLPYGLQPRIGNGYGPEDITQALEYGMLSQSDATVTTSLVIRAALDEPAMEVYNYATNLLIPDGNLTRDTTLGTDFGSTLYGTAHLFEIRDFGTADLQLLGSPTVVISGNNANAFRVIRQPATYVGAGTSTYFTIEYIPTLGGTQTADVTIYSNDSRTSPYTFRIYGGSGSGVSPDVYEDDGPKAIDTDANWDAEFAQIKASARAISTQGAMQAHTIHASNDVDWVRFTLENTSNTVIETFAPVGDTRLYLYDEDGNRIAMDDNSGPGNSAKIGTEDAFATRALNLSPGTYYVRIDESGNNAVVPFYALYVRAGDAAANPTAYIDASRKLWVWGTTQDDTISVDLQNASVRVVRNANTWFFPLTELDSVEIRAGWGNDTVYVGAGIPMTTILGGLGDDSITYASNSNAWIAGGVGNDFIQGGDGNDHINAKDGNDTIYGGAGNDRLQGGWDDDLIYGEAGNDDIMANYGNDTVYGGTGNDSIDGYYGDDSLFGEEGDDMILGGQGRDYINGGPGVNQLTSWQDGEVDTVVTTSAQDVLYVDNDPAGVLDVVQNG